MPTLQHHLNSLNLSYKSNKQLHWGKINLNKLALEYGTPLHVYSAEEISKQVSSYQHSIKKYSKKYKDFAPALLCYAVKANPNVHILKYLQSLNVGADIVSGGELYRCMHAGIDSQKIVFSGVGKQKDEIIAAIKEDIFLFSVESESELKVIAEVANELQIRARISLRVNPTLGGKDYTHSYITTGTEQDKFGITGIKKILSLYEFIESNPFLQAKGISFHIGSQLLAVNSLKEAAFRIKEIFLKIRSLKINLDCIDVGGGLGIVYDYRTQNPVTIDEYIRTLYEILGIEAQLIFEPGRSIMGNSGILLSKLLYNKTRQSKKFYIVDAAMNDLARPSLYDAYHEIIPCTSNQSKESNETQVDVVGPICESGDFLAKDRLLPDMSENTFLAILSTGAYGSSMSSNYNSRPKAAEILLEKEKVHLIAARQSYEDLLKNEIHNEIV